MKTEMINNHLKWLENDEADFEDLSEDELSALLLFSLNWSFFEAEVFENSINANEIIEKAREWGGAGLVTDEYYHTEFEQYLNYFRDRYITDGRTNDRYQALNLRGNDRSDLVEDVLLGNNDEATDVISSILIIVYRFRNNFFHGYKWEYHFENQLENFRNANDILCKVIQLNRSE